ncbi:MULTISPECIES: carbohydrate ABC transporter permease [Halomonadaceae]|jgi:glycerol transport system permease protein|uniref:Trehalose transport system permease protein SugB n=1 Tax=Vreelandella titanicae TaxID=664683 RepID=A0A653QRV8_9GAMM|nr:MULTISPECIES: carbohydrate ABC transporter permease [Halomonas]UEQ06152.1 carbohydrate ABC transporter permease [Halomonas profundus]EHA16840.1 binding-protein-dependent transport systems inner membrane component [Halomonas sp. HAL1]MBT2788190.1 carbohydrate ABC transporter permease [Halomonas sp. ISL-106]MBT2795939.1 carbohydrate ABC transporter permease [Halomonas sp. ISL-104]MDQ7727643.1 carbohydrate ABC transporter permease [Halomonas sp. SpR8]
MSYQLENTQRGEKYNTIFSKVSPAKRRNRTARAHWRSRILLGLYLALMILPIYWLINMSLQTNSEILGSMTLWPQNLTFDNYIGIFTNSSWYMGYVNSMLYVAMNMLITICVALPAAYAFSRYTFIGDKHLFFWLLTNLMAPPAVFLLPYFQLYYSVGLFDTHIAVALAHCLFNIPLAIWILEGFMSSVPKEIDETAYIDGYSFPRFFVKIFIPMIRSGIGVTLFFLFMFSWVELLLARTLTATDAQPIGMIMTRTSTASGIDWGTLAAAGVLTIIPGILVVYFVRNHIAKGFALGRT